MTTSEILIIIFFLIGLFLPPRPWIVKKNEFKAGVVFALVFPLVMQPIWIYRPEAWTLYIFHTPLFIMLYWLVFITLSINISDWMASCFCGRMRKDKSYGLILLTDIFAFGILGMLCESIFFHLGCFGYSKGVSFGSFGLFEIPYIVIFGYVGLAVFGARTFRLKKKERIL